MPPHDVASALRSVRARVDAACRAAGRATADVTLVAISKTHPADAIRAAYAAGQRDFGENYAQELRDKARELADLTDLRWHFVGPLQTNKAKYVAGVACCFHALDRAELAVELGKRVSALGRPLDVLLEVNVGTEASKHGVSPDMVGALHRSVAAVAGLNVRGLMCIPPPRENAEDARADFQRLRALAAEQGLAQLSMGMSDDFEVAVSEGATLVRVGTAIFGPRPAKEAG